MVKSNHAYSYTAPTVENFLMVLPNLMTTSIRCSKVEKSLCWSPYPFLWKKLSLLQKPLLWEANHLILKTESFWYELLRVRPLMTDRSILLCLMRRSTQHGALWMRLALRFWSQRQSMWHIFTFRPSKALWTRSRSLDLTKFRLDPIWEQIKIDVILLFEWESYLLLISLAIVNYCRLLYYKI